MPRLIIASLLFAALAVPLRAQDTSVYLADQVDRLPRRVSGPTLTYPRAVLRMGDGERVLIEAVFDTSGRIEPESFRVVQTVDSEMNASVRAALLATRYSPALREGHPVRLLAQLWLVLHTEGAAVNATALVGQARERSLAGAQDSALALLREALDSAAHPSDGERAYALLVRGVVETRQGRSEAGALDERRGLDLWSLERARGVELAPFLNDLADSVRLARSGGHAVGAGEHLVVVGTVDVSPVLLSRPPVVYPPEARALGVAGTVVVEADVDSAGRVTGARVVESPNPLLDAPAVRIVQASRYRPGRRAGRAVAIRIRQPITFRP